MAKKLNSDSTATHKALLLYTQLLFSGKRHGLVDIAKQFNCSKATVIRLIESIERSEVAEISSGLENGKRWYQLKHLPGTPHIGLTGDEVEKLALCRDLLERLLPEGIERVIADGIVKVSALMERADSRAESTAPKAGRTSWGRIAYAPSHQTVMECLLKAIPDHTVCMVEYRELEYRFPERTREPVTYEFVPLRLTTEDDALQVEGWLVTDRGTPKTVHPLTLAVHRILSCSPTRRNMPECPALPEHEGAFGLVGYKAFPVRIAFCEEFSGFIRERTWSKGQEVFDLPDGRVELRFMAADENELIGWVLSFGNGAELLEPQELREAIFEEVQDLWDVYATDEET